MIFVWRGVSAECKLGLGALELGRDEFKDILGNCNGRGALFKE